jgi:hypothetical protein
MAIDLHTVEMVDGSTQARSDRLIAGLQLSVPNASGAASTPVVTAVSFPAGALPTNYACFVDSGQADVFVSVTNKTSSGFTVTLTPISGVAVAAGVFNVLVLG